MEKKEAQQLYSIIKSVHANDERRRLLKATDWWTYFRPEMQSGPARRTATAF